MNRPGLLFKFRLAKELGKTYRELVEGKPGLADWELVYWEALERIDGPWGDWRGDYQAARLAAAIAAAHGVASSPADHMPEWHAAPAGRQSLDEMKMQWAAAEAAFNRARQ